MDIMAAAAKVDPLEFRMRNLKEERARRVLKAAADTFGWKAAPGPSGQGRAIAVGSGAIQVRRVVAAQDMGLVINPEGAKMQMEGCVAMGLGYVLSEELRFRGGEILDQNFSTYLLRRFSYATDRDRAHKE